MTVRPKYYSKASKNYLCKLDGGDNVDGDVMDDLVRQNQDVDRLFNQRLLRNVPVDENLHQRAPETRKCDDEDHHRLLHVRYFDQQSAFVIYHVGKKIKEL